MRTIIRWSLIIGFSAFVIWILNKYRKCRNKGEESGKVYECNPFSSVPTFLVPDEIRYQMFENKCYEVTDYGKKMSYKEVGSENCRVSEI